MRVVTDRGVNLRAFRAMPQRYLEVFCLCVSGKPAGHGMPCPGVDGGSGRQEKSAVLEDYQIVKQLILSGFSRFNSGSPWQRSIVASGCIASLSVLLFCFAGLIFEWRSVVGSGLIVAGIDVFSRVFGALFVAALAFVPFGLLLRASDKLRRPIAHAIFGVCVLLLFLGFIALEWIRPPAGGGSFVLVFYPLYASLAVMALEFGCKLYSWLRK